MRAGIPGACSRQTALGVVKSEGFPALRLPEEPLLTRWQQKGGKEKEETS